MTTPPRKQRKKAKGRTTRSKLTSARRFTTPDYLPSLDDFERRITRACDNLRSREYPEPQALTGMIDAAAAEVGVGALRHLRCAIREIREGWERESGVHIRAIWEAARDLALILAWRERKTGLERAALARRFLALRLVRAPTLAESIAKHEKDPTSDAKRVALYRALESEFRGRGLDVKKHWSGLSQKNIEALARPMVDSLAGQEVFAVVRNTAYNATALQSHSDPGMELMLPRDKRGRPSPDAATDFHTTSPISAYGVAAILSLVLASRLDANELSDARAAFEQLSKLEAKAQT